MTPTTTPTTPAEPTVQQLLDFESDHPRFTAVKEELIRAQFGMPPARYYQLLHRAVRTPDGVAADPITARRVRERIAPHA